MQCCYQPRPLWTSNGEDDKGTVSSLNLEGLVADSRTGAESATPDELSHDRDRYLKESSTMFQNVNKKLTSSYIHQNKHHQKQPAAILSGFTWLNHNGTSSTWSKGEAIDTAREAACEAACEAATTATRPGALNFTG